MSVVPYSTGTLADRAPALQVAADIAKAIANTEFVPTAFRGNPAAIAAAILYGDEVGLGPMQSLNRIAVIDGRPTLYAEAQRALVLAAGHQLWIEESTVTRCTVAGRRRDSDEVTRVTWTMDDAKRAGVAGKHAWSKYPRQMLLARASAELARTIFADAIGGLAAVEEIDGGGVTSPLTGETPVPTTPVVRRRRPTTEGGGRSQSPPSDPDDDDAGGAGVREPRRPEPPSDEHAAEVEPPASEQSEPDPMTDAQRARMMALFREKGFSERAHRLAFTSAMLRRHIETSADLSKADASHLIDVLENQPVVGGTDV